MTSFTIFVIGILTGVIDAIAGGSGLIMVPTYIFFGLPPVVAVATNKLCNVAASIVSGWQYALNGKVHWRSLKYMVLPAAVSSYFGSRCLVTIDKQILDIVLAVVIGAIAVFLIFKPKFGREAQPTPPHEKPKQMGLGAAVGFHDGFFGPGAGIFFTLSLIKTAGLDFLSAMATSKAINVFTSVVALGIFLSMGLVDIKYGLIGSAGISVGSFFGARIAVYKGASLVRWVFMIVAVLMSLRLFLQ